MASLEGDGRVMPVETIPLAGAIGAEVRGVDVAQIDEETFAQVHKALLDFGVIYFRDQRLSPDQQLAFARRWGEAHLHPYLKGLAERPEIIEIVKEPEERRGFGDHWHTDQIFTPAPAMGTMLYAKVTPAFGGDTLFASMYAAYEALSPAMQRLCAQLKTWNLYDKQAPRAGSMSNKIPEQEKPAVPAIHPLVRVHPETRRPALYLTDMQTTRRFDGLSEEESRPLLAYLLQHATRPELTCRLRWEPGTLAIWDNRCTMHMALNDYHGQRLVMHRITIKGEPTFGLDAVAQRAA